MSDADPKRKIIVDDDWKERVQAEKEAFKQQQSPQAESGATGPAAAESQTGETVPPASLPLLVSSLATQALFALGQIPDPAHGNTVFQPEVAKHHIDMLGVLEEKTAGNLTAEESQMLSDALHDLRMIFVAVKNAPPAGQG